MGCHRNHKFHQYCLLLWIWVIPVMVYGQDPMHSFLTISDGLPSNETYWIHQDKTGDLWIATDHGVVKYDGETMRTFTTENGLVDNTVFKIYEDYQNRLWFLTFKGGICYLENDTVKTPPFNERLQAHILAKDITNHPYFIHVDSSDRVYLSAYLETGGYYHAKSGDSEVSYVPLELPGGFKSGNFILKKNEKLLVSGVLNSEKARIPPSGNPKRDLPGELTLDFIPLTEPGVPRRHIVISDSLGRPEFLAVRNKLYEWVEGELALRETFQRSILSLSRIENDILVGNKEGLYHYTRDKNGIHLVGKYFDDLLIAHVTRSRSGDYWICTREKGVIKVPSFSIRQYTLPEELRGLYTLSDFYFRRDTLRVLNQGILHTLIKGNSPQLQHTKSKQIEGEAFGIYHSWGDQNNIYCGGGFELTYSADGSTLVVRDRFTVLDKFPQSYTNRKILPSPIKEGKFMMSTSSGFLILTKDSVLINSLSYNFDQGVNVMAEHPDGSYWIGTFHGLYHFKNGLIAFMGDEYTALRSRIEDIKVREDGSVFVATRGAGVCVILNDKVMTFTEDEGLSSNLCGKVLLKEDAAWIGTNRGLDRLCWDGSGNYQITRLGIEGESGIGFVGDIYDNGEQVVLQGEDRLTYLNVDDYYFNSMPPQTFVENILVGGKDYKPGAEGRLNFRSYQNTIQFRYRMNCLIGNSLVRYKYRLSGVSNEWVTTNETEVSFTDLLPGKYSFELMASNAQGVWTPMPVRVDFKITNIWYAQAWFQYTAGLSMAAFIFFGLLWSIRNNQKRIVREKGLMISQLNSLKMQMNPHFLFNALNSIQYFIETGKKREANLFLSRFSSMIRNVLWSAETLKTPLVKELSKLVDYMALEKMRLEDKFTWSLNVAADIDQERTLIPTMLLQPIVENAIFHGMPQLRSDDHLEVKITLEDKVLLCVIRDNGVGIDHDPFRERKKESFGLKNIRERLALIGKIEGKKYQIEIRNLGEVNHSNGDSQQGTEVRLCIPQETNDE